MNAATENTNLEINPSVQKWIIEQAESGSQPNQVLDSMIQAGWTRSLALKAIMDTVADHLPQGVTPPAIGRESTGPAVLRAGENSYVIDDRTPKVCMSAHGGRIVLFDSFLSDEECDALILSATPKMTRSLTVNNATGESELNDVRTSQGCFFRRGENELVSRIEERIAKLVNWPLSHGEGIQILCYAPGAEYKPHYDSFDPNFAGSASILRRGGQRVGTVVMYLNNPPKGGSTTFPNLGLEVSPRKGSALFFAYHAGHDDKYALHAGTPVVEGEKWVATKWLRQREFG